tara:strand:+ start:773 stop:1339 length:567 start_codon:yes stop_codon:yes gene_type:complete
LSVALIIALPDEAYGIENIKGVTTYISGVGKINSAIATFQAIKRGATKIINYGSAGLVSDVNIVNKLIEPDIIIQRDMLAEPLAPRGVTPFEEGDLSGALPLPANSDITLGTGDSFVQDVDPWFRYANVDIVDMEAYSIYKTCRKFNINFKCYKWVTDYADKNAKKDWAENVSNGNLAFNKKLKEMFS